VHVGHISNISSDNSQVIKLAAFLLTNAVLDLSNFCWGGVETPKASMGLEATD